MPTIRPEPNRPLIVNLKYRNVYEKKVNGQIEFKYTLENGDTLFVPPIAHDEIQKLHAGAGEPFTLTKSIGQGNQAVWKVERIVQPSGPENAPTNRPAIEVTNVTQKSITSGKKPVAVIPPTLATPQSRAMLRQLIAAVDATLAVKAYAHSQGLELEPNCRDVFALAITGGIQVFKEGVY
jgi:hypothetical protein